MKNSKIGKMDQIKNCVMVNTLIEEVKRKATEGNGLVSQKSL